MATDAIRKDVSQAGIPDLNDPNTHLSRAAAMDAMRARRRETAALEMDDVDREAYIAAQKPLTKAPVDAEDDPDGDAVDPNVGVTNTTLEALDTPARADAATDAAADATAQVDRQLDEPTTLADADLSRYRVRTKVNGVEREVSLAELRASAQKNEAADQVLERAKAALAEINAVAAQAREAAKPKPSDVQTESDRNTSGEPDPIDTAIDSLFQGDEAKAKKLLKQAISARNTSAAETLPPDQFASQVEQRIVIRSAVRAFAKDHKDIVDDPIAREVANRFIGQELQARGVERLEDLAADVIPDVYEAAGNSTRDYFKSKAGLATPSKARVELPTSRRERKQAIDEPETASTRAASSVAPPRTTTDVINSMRTARGQLAPSN